MWFTGRVMQNVSPKGEKVVIFFQIKLKISKKWVSFYVEATVWVKMN